MRKVCVITKLTALRFCVWYKDLLVKTGNVNYAKIYPLRPGASNYLLPVGNNHKRCYLGVEGWGSGIHGEGCIPYTPIQVFDLSWWVCMLCFPLVLLLQPPTCQIILPVVMIVSSEKLILFKSISSLQFSQAAIITDHCQVIYRPTTYCWRVKHYLMWGSRHLGTFHETEYLLYI